MIKITHLASNSWVHLSSFAYASMVAPDNDFRGQIKVVLPCWKDLSNVAFHVCNDVFFQSRSQCANNIDLRPPGYFAVSFFRGLIQHDCRSFRHPNSTCRTMLHMFVVLWWPGGSTKMFSSHFYCILAKVLTIRTNLWHVFRLFLLKLTCSPLKIVGWEVTFLLGAGLFSCFFSRLVAVGKSVQVTLASHQALEMHWLSWNKFVIVETLGGMGWKHP